jgi:hypothetical protein
MSYSEALSERTIAISVSNSPDLGPLGMSDAHLQDATAEIARHLLALGARIAYGGDLRQRGFTEVLFELVARHKRDADEGDGRSAVLSYLAWPVHISKPAHDLARYEEELAGLATLLLLDEAGVPMTGAGRRDLPPRKPRSQEWSDGLTKMRERMNTDSDARIIAGGQVEGYQGSMPGIAEEAIIALRAGRPLFILGGFGGCAADIAVSVGLMEGHETERRDWENRWLFDDVHFDQLSNGLSIDENRTLASTPHVDEAIALILRGLLRLENGAADHSRHR